MIFDTGKAFSYIFTQMIFDAMEGDKKAIFLLVFLIVLLGSILLFMIL